MPNWSYSNLSDRAPGPFVSAAARLVPGVRQVRDQIGPYAAAWQEHNRQALRQDGPLWVALGDSMTQGIGASAYDRGWVGQLAGRLAGCGLVSRVVNLSVSGARVAEVLGRQLPALEALETTGTLAGPPALVTLLIGSNDLIRRRRRLESPATFELLLQRLPAGTVVANLPNPNRAAAAVNRSLQQAVTDRGLVLAELRRGRTVSWRGRLAADHFHPNDRGYAAIVDAFAAAILPAAGDPTPRAP